MRGPISPDDQSGDFAAERQAHPGRPREAHRAEAARGSARQEPARQQPSFAARPAEQARQPDSRESLRGGADDSDGGDGPAKLAATPVSAPSTVEPPAPTAPAEPAGAARPDLAAVFAQLPPAERRVAGFPVAALVASSHPVIDLRHGHDGPVITPGPRGHGDAPAAPPRDEGEAEEIVPPDAVPFPLPQGAGLLSGGLPLGLAALDRVFRELTEAELLNNGRFTLLGQCLGVSCWVAAAALAYLAARRPRAAAALPEPGLVVEELP